METILFSGILPAIDILTWLWLMDAGQGLGIESLDFHIFSICYNISLRFFSLCLFQSHLRSVSLFSLILTFVDAPSSLPALFISDEDGCGT